jgi:hypothetical protein
MIELVTMTGWLILSLVIFTGLLALLETLIEHKGK